MLSVWLGQQLLAALSYNIFQGPTELSLLSYLFASFDFHDGLMHLLQSFHLLHEICCTDNNEADEEQSHMEAQFQSSPVPGVSHPGMMAASVQYPTLPQAGGGHAVVRYSNLYSAFH